MLFPCKNCLVLPVCSMGCDEVEKRINRSISDLLCRNICPDCGTNNKFNIRQSFILYNVKCCFCKHTFYMLAKNFRTREFKK